MLMISKPGNPMFRINSRDLTPSTGFACGSCSPKHRVRCPNSFKTLSNTNSAVCREREREAEATSCRVCSEASVYKYTTQRSAAPHLSPQKHTTRGHIGAWGKLTTASGDKKCVQGSAGHNNSSSSSSSSRLVTTQHNPALSTRQPFSTRTKVTQRTSAPLVLTALTMHGPVCSFCVVYLFEVWSLSYLIAPIQGIDSWSSGIDYYYKQCVCLFV